MKTERNKKKVLLLVCIQNSYIELKTAAFTELRFRLLQAFQGILADS